VGKNLSINEAELFAGNILADFDLVIPGSEDFLVKGIADGKINVFGPDSAGARLEGSKCFAKLFMRNTIYLPQNSRLRETKFSLLMHSNHSHLLMLLKQMGLRKVKV